MRATWPLALQRAGDLGRHPAQLVVEPLAVGDVALERVLDADRDPLGVELELARVDAAGAVAEHRPDAARQQAAQLVVGERGELADRLDRRRVASRSSAFGPTPGQPAHGERREERRLPARPARPTSPPGLRASLATFATTLHGATPSEHVRLVAARTAVRTASATTRASRKSAATSPMSR